MVLHCLLCLLHTWYQVRHNRPKNNEAKQKEKADSKEKKIRYRQRHKERQTGKKEGGKKRVAVGPNFIPAASVYYIRWFRNLCRHFTRADEGAGHLTQVLQRCWVLSRAWSTVPIGRCNGKQQTTTRLGGQRPRLGSECNNYNRNTRMLQHGLLPAS